MLKQIVEPINSIINLTMIQITIFGVLYYVQIGANFLSKIF